MPFTFKFKRKTPGDATDAAVREVIKAELRSLNRKLKVLDETDVTLEAEFKDE
jgi:hypothetical protein